MLWGSHNPGAARHKIWETVVSVGFMEVTERLCDLHGNIIDIKPYFPIMIHGQRLAKPNVNIPPY